MIKAAEPMGMNNHRLELLIRDVAELVVGDLGAWRFDVDGIRMYCITDEYHDRMRIITPVANVDELTAEVLSRCMEANFDRALDARYCIHHGTLWGAFIHPLRALDEQQFRSAIAQVQQVARNFGNTYSSGPLIFGAPQI